jgi:hypothetical protein
MASVPNVPVDDALARLFYEFRVAQLNQRYYTKRLSRYQVWDKIFQITVGAVTATSFALLLFSDFTHTKIIVAILSAVAFVFSVAVPSFGLSRNIEEAKQRSISWHYAGLQLENALRFIKNSQREDGEINGLVMAAENAYHLAAALPDAEADDKKLIQKLEGEINESFPPDYVWKAR